MPRSFSEPEREAIRSRLIGKAIESMERFGVRKSNVEWIARASGISKGGFYLFYASKEELLFDAFVEVQSRVRGELMAGLERLQTDLSSPLQRQKAASHEIRFFLEFLFHCFEKYPVLTVLSRTQELAALMRGIDPKRQQAESQSDDRFFQKIFKDWEKRKILGRHKAARLAGLPALALALTLEKDLIGGKRFQDTKSLLINGLVLELAGPRN